MTEGQLYTPLEPAFAIGGVTVLRTRMGVICLGRNEAEVAAVMKAVSGNASGAHYNPNEPRDGHGRWTSDGGGSSPHMKPGAQLVSDRTDTSPKAGHTAKDFGWDKPLTPAGALDSDKKQFASVLSPLISDISTKYNIPKANILGLIAKESGYGRGRFSIKGNNLFNFEGDKSPTGESLQAHGSTSKVYKFADYEDCINFFGKKYGPIFQNVISPQDFVDKAQANGFGVEKIPHKNKMGRTYYTYPPNLDYKSKLISVIGTVGKYVSD